MLTRSLFFQAVISLFFLAVMMMTQLLLSHDDIQTLDGNQKNIIESYDNLGRVYELERDVIDLQRNLLIYKETGSESSIERFFSAMERVIGELEFLEKNTNNNPSLERYNKLINRMLGHLNDFQENFIGVISGRSQRDELEKEIEGLVQKLSDQSIKYYPANSTEQSKINFHLSIVARSLYQYLHTPDSEYISEVKANKAKLNKIIARSPNKNILQPTLNKLSKRFIKLTHVTRGYTYLVNVVMAGSANEFLYLSEKLRTQVQKDKNVLVLSADDSSQRILFNNNVEVVLALLVIMLMALFLSKRILLPIKGITDVFRILSRGDEVDKIPSTDRTDEVGDLAKAAAVFHKKNQLTHELLERSQDMIANKEVMNIQLEAEKDKAEKAAKSKSMFLANMSHEIRTPMNGIVGLVDLMMKTELDKKQKNYLERIAYSGQIMMNVINDILDFSKIEAGKMEIEAVEFDINTVIENLISAMAIRVNEKSLDFRVIVEPNVHQKIIGDSLRISQILLNLCSNSVKFTDGGYVELLISQNEESLMFKVHDTGIGMSDAQVSTIFQSFTQADGSTSRKYGGTGLGLTIVKQLVKLMGGEIELSSIEGTGTTIVLSINIKNVDDITVHDSIETVDKKLLYLSDSEDTVKDSKLLKGNGIPFYESHEVSVDLLESMEADQPILIQGYSKAYIDSLSPLINAALTRNTKVGFLLHTHQSNLKQKIEAEWSLNALIHPFTPEQFNLYLSKLYGEGEGIKEEAEEQTLRQYDGHALLVEDNHINQLVAGDMLESLGLTFDVAENGVEALDKIEANPNYDLVFMDVQMPIMDGYEATLMIRQKGLANIVICGLSANAMKDDLDRAKEVGMNDYLTKPLQIKEMDQLIKKYLKQRQ